MELENKRKVGTKNLFKICYFRVYGYAGLSLKLFYFLLWAVQCI